MTDRGLTPVVGKAFELGIVVVLVGLLSTTLFVGAVPFYTAVTDDRIADRTLTAGAHTIQAAMSSSETMTNRLVRRRMPLPTTIGGERYTLRVQDDRLALVHPAEAIQRTVELAFPEAVTAARGEVPSDADGIVVTVHRSEAGLTVTVSGWSG